MLRQLPFVGDIYLGRRPVGLDAALAAAGLSGRELSPAAGWHKRPQGARSVTADGLSGQRTRTARCRRS